MTTSVCKPSFDKDFAFLKQLHAENKEYQDMIWKKFSLMKVNSDKPRHLKHNFDSHPSGFSSETENNNTDEMEEFFKDQPDFGSSNCSLVLSWAKEKQKSASAGKMFSNETARRKLRKKITKHLRNGTIDKFDIKGIGDQLAADRMAEKQKKKLAKKKLAERNEEEKKKLAEKNLTDGNEDEIKEVYVDSSNRCMLSTPSITSKSSSFSSLDALDENKDLPSSSKLREKEITEKVETVMTNKKIKATVVFETKETKGKERKSNNTKPKDSSKTHLAFLLTELNKSRHFIEKCLSMIKDIGELLNEDVIPPDGKEDLARRKVRTNEFNSRFSRTYMYPLVRQLSSISVPGNADKSPKDFPRLATTFQLIFQALQAYNNHLPSTIGRNSYHKLREYLAYVMDVCDKSRRFFEKQPNCAIHEYSDTLKSECNFLINKIDDNFLCASVDSLLKSRNPKSGVPTSRSNKNIMMPKSKMKENVPNGRYAMYNDCMASKRDRQWRRMLEAVEKRKPKVKSRYRTATFKHRPPIEKQNDQMIVQHGKHRLDARKSSTSWKNTPVATPINDDNIQTMIQYEKEYYNGKEDSGNDELEEEGEEEEQKEETQGKTVIQPAKDLNEDDNKHQPDDIFGRLLRLVQDNQPQANMEPDVSLTQTLMVLQQCLDIKNQYPEFFKKMTARNQNELTIEEGCMVSCGNDTKKQKKDPKVTVTGAKNAQLICIKDDNSIVEEVEESTKHVVPQNSPRKTPKHSDVHSSKSELTMDEVKTFPSRMSIKISRINRSRRVLQPLPRQYVVNIIQNKLLFHKECKSNYMYRQTPNGKPWECLDEISDKVLDYALMGVVKEIQANELIENIYNAEFQY
ncbi:hypothetical protein WA026_000584 [Henosepilachna vigintioctopunctata]|uniref:Uncharacterized protein n=1 Tax=Henosepilachna vigintioctopunctata TaxID=420089 RepID=A0AAW1V4M7_9CUCU